MSKHIEVRSRRAYFDTRLGQLHVRTAFPGTGGFDEHTTVFCIHAAGAGASSRAFVGLLPLLAADRSVYAPDRPGHGESDGEAGSDVATHAAAMADLAADLRLRKIDVLGVGDGAAVALALAADKPDLVRRVVLIAAPAGGAPAAQPTLNLRLGAAGSAEFPADALTSQPAALAKAISAFLNQR
jgi:pimeloyl-ACP methyl ester carboxylesterase